VDLVPAVPAVLVQAPLPRRVFAHEQRGFALALPESWEVHASEDAAGMNVHLASADGTMRVDLVSVVVGQRTTLDQFASDVLRAIVANIGTPSRIEPLHEAAPPQLVRHSMEKVGAVDWKMYVHRHADAEGVDRYWVSMISLKDARGYVVRYSAPVQAWPNVREMLREMVGGVSIL
jgi:hypothetical protein